MHLSRYLKIYPSKEFSENVILFSTKNSAIVEIPKAIADDLPDAELSKEDRRTLKNLGFLIDDPEKERREMLGFIDEDNKLSRTLVVKLVMNLDCNLACRYCFEGKRKGWHYMTGETADDFIKFVKTKITTPRPSLSRRGKGGRGFKEIFIIFYGGEPLLSKELIVYLSKKLKALAENKGLKYSSCFMTNGTLLTKETVRILKHLGLKEAYITIDGPKDIHDASRPFKSGRGSFEAIVRNLKDVCSRIKIGLGGNFTRNNYKRFPELLDYLKENGLTPRKLSVRGFFAVLAESAEFGPADFHDGCLSLNEPWFFRARLFLREEIAKRGYGLEKTTQAGCMVEFDNNIIVNYDGSIYKCPSLIGREEYKAGDVRAGIKDYRLTHNLDNWKNDECLDCAYLPMCFGGCRYMKLVREGDMDGVDCKKPYFDATLEELVNQDIRYRIKNK